MTKAKREKLIKKFKQQQKMITDQFKEDLKSGDMDTYVKEGKIWYGQVELRLGEFR